MLAINSSIFLWIRIFDHHLITSAKSQKGLNSVENDEWSSFCLPTNNKHDELVKRTYPLLLWSYQVWEQRTLRHDIMDEQRPQLCGKEEGARPQPPLKAHLDAGKLQLDDGLVLVSPWVTRRAGPRIQMRWRVHWGGGGRRLGRGYWGGRGSGDGRGTTKVTVGTELDGAALELEVEECEDVVPSEEVVVCWWIPKHI